MFFKFILICIFNHSTNAVQLDDCYYLKDDSVLNFQTQVPIQQTFIFDDTNLQFDSIGFGIWTKWLANIQYNLTNYPQRPFDDPNCQFESCVLEGFYFMNIFDLNQINIATIILKMSDDPLIMSHDIYIFPYDNQQYQMESFIFDPSQYSNVWIYTSIIYQYQDQKLFIYTNFQNQLKIFTYQIRTNGFSIIFGGFKDDLSQNLVKTGQTLLFYKGKFSAPQDFGNFKFNDNFYNDLFINCFMQEQKSALIVSDIFKAFQFDYDNPTTINLFTWLISGRRYTLKGWVKQRYDKALNVMQQNGMPYSPILTQILIQGTANMNMQFSHIFNGDIGFVLSYEVDLENNNKTKIFIQTYFLKIPLLTPIYNEMEQYFKCTIEGDDYYQKTSAWHYFVFDYGREPINGQTAQFRLYFMNEEPIIRNFGTQGFNSQFHGPEIDIYILCLNSEGLNSYALMFEFLYYTGQTTDNNDKYKCDASCFDCNGPYQSNCTICYEQNNYFLTQFNTCECKYLYQIDPISEICVPIEDSQNLQIIQTSINNSCSFGYFSFTYQNIFYCLECPKQQKNALICGDCYEKQISWYLKPMCTYDYIQNSEDFVYIRYDRRNQDIDVYYINENMNLMLEDGASLMCDQNQIGCYKSKNYHLGQQIKIQCKLNRYYNQQVCSYCDQLCINCDLNGNCLECQDQYYFDLQSQSCQYCPQCQSCQTDFNSILGFKCTKCIKQYAILEGLCMPCGLNCDYCQQDFNQQSQKYFLRCLSCIDNTIMSVRLNAIDCKIIDIKNCLYPLIYSSDNFLVNNFDIFLQPQDDSSLEQFGCSICKKNYYLDNLQTCLEASDELIEFFTDCDSFIQLHLVFQNVDYGTQILCLMGNKTIYPFILLGSECSAMVDNCYFCLTIINSERGKCLKCNQGYYANKFTGYCQNCPSELNCQTCSQTPIGYNDEWKIWVSPIVQFLGAIFNFDTYYDFRQHLQSQKEQDYEIICTSCYKGYILFNNTCIKYCDPDCLNCLLIDGQYKCQSCESTTYTKVLSFIQYKCSACSSYCEFCTERTVDQLTQINPMFENGNQHPIYQYQCLKPLYFQNDNLYYNSDIGQFLQCEKKNPTMGCQNTLQIKLNLYCSSEAYNLDLNNQIDQKSQILFKQRNILFDSLVTNLVNESSFKQFETDEINNVLSLKLVKQIEIIVETQISQVCTVSTLSYIQQFFSKNLINLNHVSLSIVSTENQLLTIQIIEELHFLYFSQLTFKNVNLQFQTNIYWKKLIMNSLWPQTIILNSSLVTTTQPIKSTVFTIIIDNAASFIMDNFQFRNFNAENNGQISLLQLITNSKSIIDNTFQLINFQIIECTLNNLTFLNIEANEFYSIEINQMLIRATFYNSKFLTFQSDKKVKQFQFSNSNISGNITQSLPFMSLGNINLIFLNNIILSLSMITDSIIFQIDKYLSSEFLYLDSCQTFGQVSFIENYNDEQNGNIKNFTVINLKYGINTKLINLKILKSSESKLQLLSVSLINNQINLDEELKIETQTYLMSIEQKNIVVDTVNIVRGIGISEFLFQNVEQLILNNFKVTAAQFYTLHQFQECSSFFKFQNYFKIIIQIQNTLNVVIQNTAFELINFINNPMILIQRESNFISEQVDSIIISNLKVTNTTQILTQENAQTSLIKLSQTSKIIINLNSCTFQTNQLHMYYQNTLLNSAVLLLITCPSGILFFEQSNLISNFVSNGTDTIISITANQIMIDSVNFYNNSNFDAQILAQHLDWGFDQGLMIDENNLKQIFHFKNIIGNGFYEAKRVEIRNVNIANSQGKNGVGFYIQATQIVIVNANFLNLKTFFQYNEENGGCLYFYLSTDNCRIEIRNITFNSIQTQDFGGIVYIQSDFDNLNLILENVSVTDTFSIKGSILYASFQKNSINNLVQLNNLKIKNSELGLLKYLQNINDISKFSGFLTNRILVYLFNCVLLFSHILIEANFKESLLKCENQGNITINDLYVFSGQINTQSFLDITPRQDYYVQIILKNIFIKNVISFQNYNYPNGSCQLNQQAQTSQYSYMQCNLHFDIIEQAYLTKLLLFEKDSKNLTYGKCIYQYLSESVKLDKNSLIQINSIKEENQIQFININFENNNLNYSNQGLIFLQVIRQSIKLNFNIELKDILIKNNFCGNAGCLYFNSDILNANDYQSSLIRILNLQTDILFANSNPDLFIKKYLCVDNVSGYGTCIFSKNLNLIVEESVFSRNIAGLIGGAIFFEGQHFFLYLLKCTIQMNKAQIGGGVYYLDGIGQNQEKFQTKIIQNIASNFGNDFAQSPSHLSITLNNYKSIFKINQIESSNNYVREEVINSQLQYFQPIYLPSGTPISNYKIINYEKMELVPLNLTFRIVPLDSYLQKISNLSGTSCSIKTKILQISENLIYNSSQAHINSNFFEFNSTSQDYNLDNLILYFDSDNFESALQLQVACSDMMIPVYDNQNFSVVNFHRNYTLLINIKTFYCRIGEIKSLFDFSCHECDPSQDQYSIQLNATKCSLRDEQTTISVESFKLNIRPNYWRPNYQNNIIENCLNLKENCLGGWYVGDESCYLGHIGALCESCDLYNTRGQGQFSVSKLYSCGSCNVILYNILQIIVFSLWSLITIILSVKGNMTKQHTYPQSPQLIKILTNYLQIISSLTSFKLNLPINLFVFINGIGTPLSRISDSMDCFLSQITSVQIHYARFIWQLLIPCSYFSLLSLIYGILIYQKKIQYSGSIVSTALIYMYIYFQPSLIGTLIALISSRVVSGISWIQANMAYHFDTSQHYKWVYMMCTPLLLLFGVLIPLILFLSLYRIKDQLIYKKGKSMLGYLYYEYKPKAYFWEIVKILNKQFLILFLIYYEDSIILKGTLIYVLLFCYRSLNQKYLPFKLQKFNNLDYESTAICGISIIFGIGLSIDSTTKSQTIQSIYFYILILINIYIVCKLLYTIVVAYSEEFEKSFELIKQSISKILPNRFKQNYYCFKILKSRVESRERAFKNFKILLLAYKKQKQKKSQFQLAPSTNSLLSLQTTYRFNTYEREKKLSEAGLLPQFKKNINH